MIGARVRKSRQKEAAGAADAVLMQIEWSEAEAEARNRLDAFIRELLSNVDLYPYSREMDALPWGSVPL